jgi:hypothetical protein
MPTRSKKNRKKLSSASQVAKEKTDSKVHPWRPCPLGQHWVRKTTVHYHPSHKNPDGKVGPRRGTCANNKSRKDQLFKDDILEIAERHFAGLSGPPVANNLGPENGNDFDELIRGWTRYWNELFNPVDPLDPNLVKALIFSESTFDINASNHLKGQGGARGLLQVTNGTVTFLSEHSTELKDHFVNLDREDMLDPNLTICAGIRWLFRKKQIADSRSGGTATWRDAVLLYKTYETNNPHMRGFDNAYKKLKGK